MNNLFRVGLNLFMIVYMIFVLTHNPFNLERNKLPMQQKSVILSYYRKYREVQYFLCKILIHTYTFYFFKYCKIYLIKKERSTILAAHAHHNPPPPNGIEMVVNEPYNSLYQTLLLSNNPNKGVNISHPGTPHFPIVSLISPNLTKWHLEMRCFLSMLYQISFGT